MEHDVISMSSGALTCWYRLAADEYDGNRINHLSQGDIGRHGIQRFRFPLAATADRYRDRYQIGNPRTIRYSTDSRTRVSQRNDTWRTRANTKPPNSGPGGSLAKSTPRTGQGFQVVAQVTATSRE